MKFFTVRQVVEQTSLCDRTIRGLIANGQLKVIRPLGMRVIRIPEVELQRLMQVRAKSKRAAEGQR